MKWQSRYKNEILSTSELNKYKTKCFMITNLIVGLLLGNSYESKNVSELQPKFSQEISGR